MIPDDTLAKVRDITSAYAGNVEQTNRNFSQVFDRLEAIEAGADRPNAGGAATRSTYTKQITPSGPVFIAPSTTRLQDIPELKPKARPPVSFERWLSAFVAGEHCRDKEAVDFMRESKQMLTTTTGVLVPTVYQPEWVDLLRAQSVLVQAGMRTVTMAGKVETYSAITADPTVGWHSEGASLNAANPTFVARSLTAQTLACRCQASVELAQDSPDFGAQLARVMSRALAAEVDRVGLEGTGTPPMPRGIKNTSGRSTVANIGALADYSKIISGMGSLLSSNGDLSQIAKYAVMSPGAWAAFQNLVTGISGDKTPLRRPEAIASMQFLVTSNVAGNASSSPQAKTTAYLGDFRDLLHGVRLEAAIEMLKMTTFATNLLFEFVGYLRTDFLVTRPASFCTLEGIIA